MASAQVVETSVTNNSPSQDSYHPDDLLQSRYATPGFKPFSYKEHFIDPTVRNICLKNFLIGNEGIQHFIEHQSVVSLRLRSGEPSKSHIK